MAKLAANARVAAWRITWRNAVVRPIIMGMH